MRPYSFGTSSVVELEPGYEVEPLTPELGAAIDLVAAQTVELDNAAPFPTIDFSVEDSPIEWVREPWLARDDVGVAAGAPYIGKTTWMMQLAVNVAAGTPFGDSPATDPAPVLIVDGEAGERSMRRLVRRHGGPIPGLHVVSACGKLSLLDRDSARRLRRMVRDLRPLVTIVDSVTTTFGLSNENDQAEVRRAFEELYELRELGSAVLAVHHTGKGPVDGRNARSSLDRIRGSSAFGALSSLVLRFEASPNKKALDVEIAKARDRDLHDYVRRFELVKNGGLVTLANIGDPAEAETILDAASDAVIRFLGENGRSRRKDILLAVDYTERQVDDTLKHLQKVNAIRKVDHGVYELPTRKDPEFPPEDEP